MPLPFLEPKASVEKRDNGDIILQNTIPLAPYPQNLVTWLHQHAEASPDKLFLQERNAEGMWQGLSFAEAEAQVNRLSNGLLDLDVDADKPLAILAENSIAIALLQLAALQIGQPVVLMSVASSLHSQTGAPIKHGIDLAGAAILLMSDAALHMPKISQWYQRYSQTKNLRLFALSNHEDYSDVSPFSTLFGEYNVFDSSDQVAPSSAVQARRAAVTAETVAKIQFTSGSTSLPKGVVVTHGMMTSNQVGIAQLWPFLSSHERLVDFLPWHHTFGGNVVFNLALKQGCTLYIDNGNPTPAGIDKTIENIISVKPTLYFGVPRSYRALCERMQHNNQLKHSFFQAIKFIFTAGAALDQKTYAAMKAMSAEVKGETIPFFSSWGCTETAPSTTMVYHEIDDVRVVGLPMPGVKIKLAKLKSNASNTLYSRPWRDEASDEVGMRWEIRIKGPNVTPGYLNNPEASAAAFDEEGYYCSQDAVRLADPERPEAGLIFEGRIGENFKLSSGVWVQTNELRTSINQLGQPYLLDLVIAAPDRDYLAALVFPNISTVRTRFVEASMDQPEDIAFLQSEAVITFFRDIFHQHNAKEQGLSRRFKCFTLLNIPPCFDKNEITDKGSINQKAVLTHRADQVAKLYQQATNTMETGLSPVIWISE